MPVLMFSAFQGMGDNEQLLRSSATKLALLAILTPVQALRLMSLVAAGACVCWWHSFEQHSITQ